MSKPTLLFASALAVLAALPACSSSPPPAEDVATTVQHVEAATLPSDADLAAPPPATLFFDPEWQENLQGTPYAGGKLGIVASPDRFPTCGIDGTLTAYVRVDGADPLAVPMDEDQGGWPRATLMVPSDARELEMWLHSENGDCSEWDSDLEKNYRFAVHGWQPSVVRFRADFSEQAESPLVAGGVLVVDYDLNRLSECRATDQYGLPAWDIIGHVRFSNGDQLDHSVTYPVQTTGVTHSREQGLTLFPIPEGVTGVELWFENTQQAQPFPTEGECPAWDSDFERNYPFAIAPAQDAAPQVAWAGSYDFVQYHRDPAVHMGDVDPAYYFDSMSGAELATWVEVQVYVPGVTDLAYSSTQQAAQAAKDRIVAQGVTDAFAGNADGWGTTELAFERKQGDNFVYSYRFWQLRFSMYHEPPIETGAHQYYFRFSVDGGATWTNAGKADGHARRFVVGPAMDCSLFPDHAPQGCPQAKGVGWGGNWGGLFSHACELKLGLPDPVVFAKSSLGHDCMSLTAEVWIPGVTDVDADPAQIKAEVDTDIGFEAGGPLSQNVVWPLVFDGRTGNNYRFRWDLSEHVGRADRGDYHYRFRFSADGGKNWYVLGTGEGPDGGSARTLLVRNDSLDVDATETCEDLETWQGSTSAYPTCIDYSPDANYDANYCEFYVNAFGRGSFSHNGASASWLEAYLRVAPVDGEVLNAGMWTRYLDEGKAEYVRYSMGEAVEPGYYRTGFTYAQSQMGSNVIALQPQAFAFFVDVRRPDSTVARLWMSNGSNNYTLGEVYAVPGSVQGGGSTSIEYADESVSLFNQKRSCQ